MRVQVGEGACIIDVTRNPDPALSGGGGPHTTEPPAVAAAAAALIAARSRSLSICMAVSAAQQLCQPCR
jgi:hypothetical protein